MQQGRVDEAESLFAKAIETNPADERARLHFAELIWRRGFQQEALDHLEQCVRLSGGDPEIRVRLGELRLARGELEAARVQAEAAIARHPQFAEAWALRGDIAAREGQWSRALSDYYRALSYQPRFPRAQRQVADIYRRLGRPQRALATLESLREQYALEDTPPDLFLMEASILKDLHRYDAAIDVLTVAQRRGFDSADLLFQLAEVHWLAGNVANARTAVRAALARSPNHGPSLALAQTIEQWQRTMTASLEKPDRGS